VTQVRLPGCCQQLVDACRRQLKCRQSQTQPRSAAGSTDNTIELVQGFFDKQRVPGTVASHAWENFGHNRNLCIQVRKQPCLSPTPLLAASKLEQGPCMHLSTALDGWRCCACAAWVLAKPDGCFCCR
jgi:hypothetical protein